ncbi:MAG: M1 family aminopeptidase [Pseudomonadota bacterium]
MKRARRRALQAALGTAMAGLVPRHTPFFALREVGAAGPGRSAGGTTPGARSPSTAALPQVVLDVQFDPTTRLLRGEATWTIPPGVALEMALDRRFTLEALSVDGRPRPLPEAGAPAGTTRRAIAIAAASGTRTWLLRWRGQLADLDRSIDHRGVIAALPPMASPRGSYLPAGSGWYPETTLPVHYRVRVELPSGQRAVVPGRLVSESADGTGSHAVYESMLPTEGVTLMAGPYRVDERLLPLPGGRSVRLRTYFVEGVHPLAQDYLAAAAAPIERYDKEIGPYPFDGFSIVSSPLPTGFGLPGATYIGEAVLALPFMRGQSLAHEVLHNWWGNGVRPDWRSGNWSEGLTTLMADHALRAAQSPDAARQMRWSWLRDFAAVTPGSDAPLQAFTSRTHGAASAVGYGKSAMLFHMVRGEIGEAAFHIALRDLWRSHAGRSAAWKDLQAAFERRAGLSLAALFEPMVSGTGAPLLLPQSVRAEPNGATVRLTFAEPLPYAFRLPVVAWTGERAEPATLELRRGERNATWRPPGGRMPDALQLDPGFAAWRRLAPGESPPLLRDAMLAPDARLLVASDGDEGWRSAAAELAARMLEAAKPATARLAELDAAVPLLIIGRHEDIDRLVRRDPRLIRPTLLPRQADATLWAARGNAGAPRIVASVEDTAALIDLHRRAPHYGAQGHVGFRSGRAIVSGVGSIESPRVPVAQ